MRPSLSPDFGVNVIGHVSGNLGLGVLARHVVSVLRSRGCPLRILDLDPRMGRGGHDRSSIDHAVSSVDELIYPVTLLVFSLHMTVTFLRDPRNLPLLSRSGGLNVALMNWEQMVVPMEWVSVLGGLDVIVAPSDFTRRTFEEALPHLPVVSTKVPIRLPANVRGDRSRFGLRPDMLWVGTGFEPQSDTARKNPFAVLDAFDRAVPGRSNVGLVVKVNNGTVDGQPHHVLTELRVRAQRDARIVVLEQALDYSGVLSLYASLDVFVSLHRSEGIGLGLMEAMALGKPVIATGWSGNMSFMDRSNACVVAYRLVPVRSSTYVYGEELLGPRAVWAEPDVTNASEWMRMLVERPDVRDKIGRRASDTMRRYQEDAQRAVFLDELWMILESEVSWGIGLERRTARRDRLERSLFEGDAQAGRSTGVWIRRIRSLARRVGLRRDHFQYRTARRRKKA